MALPDLLNRFISSRRFLRDLGRIAAAQESCARSLQRLADKVAPEITEASEESVRSVSGVSYSRDTEQAKILSFAERTWRELGREPTEQEIVDYLDGVPV